MKTKNLILLGGGVALLYIFLKGKAAATPHKRKPRQFPAGYTTINTFPTVITPTGTPADDTEIINFTPPTRPLDGTPFSGLPPINSGGVKTISLNGLPTPSVAPVSKYITPVNGSTDISQSDWLNALKSQATLQAFLTNVKPLKVTNPLSNTIGKIYTLDKYSWIEIYFLNKGHGYANSFKLVSLPYPNDGGMLPDPTKYWTALYMGSINDLPTTADGTSKIPGTPSIYHH
jgi:hypothetical protein